MRRASPPWCCAPTLANLASGRTWLDHLECQVRALIEREAEVIRKIAAVLDEDGVIGREAVAELSGEPPC
jgi:hypothetical protein